MKRNFLLLALAGAFALALLGSAPNASAQGCPAGTTNGGLTAGTYAIKILGSVTDTGACLPSSCLDPTPTAIQGLGVLVLDGTCDVIAGELILL